MFNFQPNVPNVLYVKAGWEVMACVKPLDLFLKECIFGQDITGTFLLESEKQRMAAPLLRVEGQQHIGSPWCHPTSDP